MNTPHSIPRPGSRALFLAVIALATALPAHATTPFAKKYSFVVGDIQSGFLSPYQGTSGGVGAALSATWNASPGTVDALVRFDNNATETGNAQILTDASSSAAFLIPVADVSTRFWAGYVHNSGYVDFGLFNFSDLSAVFTQRLSLIATAANTSLLIFPNRKIGVLQDAGASIRLSLFDGTTGALVFEQTYTSPAFLAAGGLLSGQTVNVAALPDASGYVLFQSSYALDLAGGGLTYNNSFVIAYLNNAGAVGTTTRLQTTSSGPLFASPSVLSDNSVLLNVLDQSVDPVTFAVTTRNHFYNVGSNGSLKWAKQITGGSLSGGQVQAANGSLYLTGSRDTSVGQATTSDGVFARLSSTDGSILNQAKIDLGTTDFVSISGMSGSALFATSLRPGSANGTFRTTLLKMPLDLSAVSTAVEYTRDAGFGFLSHVPANAELFFSTFENSKDIGAITLDENFGATLGCSLFTPVAVPVTSPALVAVAEAITPVAVAVNAASSTPVSGTAVFNLSHAVYTSTDICTTSTPSAPVISSPLTASGTVGTAFNYTITASNSPTSYNATGLPAGLSVNTNTGAIAGTPTAAAVTDVTISATNGTGTGQATLQITINAAPAAPVITSALTATGTVGTAFSYTITATNSPSLYGALPLPAGLSVNANTGAISGTPTAAGTTNVSITAMNGTGTGQATLQITINPLAPVISSTLTASGTVGVAFNYSITASNNPTSYNATGLPAGLAINTGTGAITGTPTTAGATNATISATNGGGTGQATLQITIGATAAAPVISSALTASGTVGASFSYTITASNGPTSYNATGLPAGLAINTNTGAITGTPTTAAVTNATIFATNGTGTGQATLQLTITANTSRLINLSVRTGAGTGNETLIVGFVVGGTGTNQVLVRGIGPTLGDFGVAGVLSDPQLLLYSGNALLQQNDDWGGGVTLSNAFSSVFAFPLAANTKDSAMLAALGSGSYTTHCSSTTGPGIALVELYDMLTPGSTARLINASARTQVGTGDGILIAGFVIDGTTSKTLLIRGIGPTLGDFGVDGVLADPQLALYSGNTVVQSNDNWGGTAPLTTAFNTVFAFGLPVGSKDAAMLVTLAPGNYTAQVSGVGATTGVALVEVYEMP